ncbi:MAG: ABC transporter permease [Enterococcus sp.]
MRTKFDNLLGRKGTFNALASLAAIILGLMIGFVFLLISNPSQSLDGFKAILTGAFSNPKNVGQVFYYATPIIMTGLSVGFSKKMGLFNIGGPGQFIVGAFVAVYIGVKWTFLPPVIHTIAALFGAFLGGVLWGIIPGIFKAYRNVNEVIICIMMNYIGMSTVNLLVRSQVYDQVKNQSYVPKSSANLPKLGMDKIFTFSGTASSVNVGFIVAIVACIAIYVLLEKTKLGYELKACGYNFQAAKYAGINEKRNIVLTMAISGGLSAMGGALLYLSGTGSGIQLTDVLAQEGFTGIPVALLGMCNPIATIFSGIFMAYLTVGGLSMQLYGFVPQIIDIISSIIIYFTAFSFFISLFLEKRFRKDTSNANDEPKPANNLTGIEVEGGTEE